VMAMTNRISGEVYTVSWDGIRVCVVSCSDIGLSETVRLKFDINCEYCM
jgi:hypothetical protein